jgi:hypothetical protein
MVVQCIVVSVLLRSLFELQLRQLIGTTIVSQSILLIVVLLILMTGVFIQTAIWSGLFVAFGEFDDINTAFYHSVVNFTTLGYGDVVMRAERRLWGALEAANGVLMLGLSTSVLYSVVKAMMSRKLQKLEDEHAHGSHSQPIKKNSSRAENNY